MPNSKPPLHYYLLWLVALVSLGLNIFIIYTLLDVRRQAAESFARAAEAVSVIKDGSIEYTVKIDEEIPIALDVPVQFTVEVPIVETIPVNTTVGVPVEIPLVGTRTISIPILANIPINLTVQVPIDKTIPVDATLPVKFDVPVTLKIADTSFGDGLEDVELLLLNLAEENGAGDNTLP
jgi:hypothetical protein